jgi:prepilin-type N-terminal cleavage/methylation domain-containing protein
MIIKKNLFGFTLIEIAIVIAITGLLVSMVISSFSKVGGTEALDTTVMTVMSVLNEAKSQAISSKNAASYGVRILPDQLISFENTYGTNNKTITISNLVTIATSTGIGTDIIFNNVTAETSASGTITITVLNDQTKKSTIRVYNTGVVEKN